MSTETHEILFKTNYAELKKAEAEYKIAVSNEIAADRIRVAEAQTTNKVIVEQAKLKNQLLLRDDADARNKQREMARAFDQAMIEDAKRTQAKLQEDQINKNAADRLRNAANTGFAANQPPPGQISSWKQLNLAIKETRSELVRLTSEGKAGSAEWTRYSERLRELVRQKQIVQRETRLTSQQLIAMSRDLVVVAYGFRQIGADIISLTEGKKSAGELAMAIGGIGIQTLTVLPAIHGLSKALQAAGVISAATIKTLGAFASTLGVVAAGVASVTAAYGLMAGAISHAGDMFGRLSAVLSGSMSYWDAIKANVTDITFGLIDMGNAADDAAGSFKYLLSLSSSSGKQFQDLIDLQNYEAKFKPGGEFFGKYNSQEAKDLIDNYKALQNVQTEYQQEQERIDQFNKNKTDMFYEDSKKKDSKGSSKTTRTQEQKQELDFLGTLRKKISDLQTEITKLGELEKTQNLAEYEKLSIMDEKIKKQKELNELMKRTGLGNLPAPMTLDNLLNQDLGFRQAGIGRNPRDAQITLQEELNKLEETRLGYAKNIGSEFMNLLQITGLMKTDFGQIVALIQSIINGATGGFSLFKSIVGFIGSFIPGGGAITSVIGGASGGGLRYGNNVNPRTSSSGAMVNVILKSVMDGQKFLLEQMPGYNSRVTLQTA